MSSERNSNLWTIAEDENEYKRYHRMLDGSLKNIVDMDKLNVNLLANSSSFEDKKAYAVILHDPSDIRKPDSGKFESLGIVKALEGKPSCWLN